MPKITKRLTALRIDPNLLEAMHRVKKREGIPIAEQVDLAVREWLKSKGIREEKGMPDTKDIARSLIEEPRYQAALVERLKAGSVSAPLLRLLKQYASQSDRSDGRAHARRVLRAAGVSWRPAGQKGGGANG